MSESVSLNLKAWRRFKRNKSAMAGLFFIGFCIVIAIFAYQFAVDSTPDANEQVLELETHPPGFEAKFLKVKKAGFDKYEQTFLDAFFNGKKSSCFLVPVIKTTTLEDSVLAEVYKGLQFPTDQKMYEKNAIEMDGSNPSLLSRKFYLGTDRFGRDILSRLIIGVRVSLFVGLVAVVISLFIGIILGAFAGYFRGWVDEAIMWLINVFWAIPTLLLAMGLYVGIGGLVESKLLLIFIAVGLTMWVDVARLVRGQFISIRESEFVTASFSLGYSHMRTIFKHILPNILGPIFVVASSNFANAILVESGLSFIGLGIQPPSPSWGGMLNEYRDFIDSDKAFLAMAPGFAIMFLVLAFNLVGNGLRDAFDVKGKIE